MKRIDLVRIIEMNGAFFVRHGSDHDWYKNSATGIAEAVPRHREIKEQLAKKIIRRLSHK
jgi:predicted RNA binding protein YcfA (HicA-like mRNA interferase family)